MHQLMLFDIGPVIPRRPSYVYSVIYSVDVPADESIVPYAPPNRFRFWKQTEGNEEYAYGYLEGVWSKGKHRKWCATLTQRQFDAFVRKLDLRAEDVETMGSLGAPGFGVSLAPAISFDVPCEYTNVIGNAYVTPCPKDSHDFWPDEKAWRTVRQQIIDTYR